MSDHSASTTLQMQWTTVTDRHGGSRLVAQWVVPATVTATPVAAAVSTTGHTISHAA